MLTTSPLAAMRSAPTTTWETAPAAIIEAAIESVISVYGMPVALELPGRQPRALEQRAGLGHQRADRGVGLVRRPHHAERRAVAARGQRPGVADGQDPARRARCRPAAVGADAPAAVHLRRVEGPRGGGEGRRELRRRPAVRGGAAGLGVDRPRQVDGRGPRRPQPRDRRARPRRAWASAPSPADRIAARATPIAPATPIAGAPRIASRRMASPTAGQSSQTEHDLLGRQPRLVEHLDGIVEEPDDLLGADGPANPHPANATEPAPVRSRSRRDVP